MGIYEIQRGKQTVIVLPANYPHVVVTNGFHYTRPVQINYHRSRTFYVAITCAVDNDRLLAGGILTLLFFLAGLTSGLAVLRILSFLPILYFLYAYYIKRKSFLQLNPC